MEFWRGTASTDVLVDRRDIVKSQIKRYKVGNIVVGPA